MEPLGYTIATVRADLEATEAEISGREEVLYWRADRALGSITPLKNLAPLHTELAARENARDIAEGMDVVHEAERVCLVYQQTLLWLNELQQKGIIAIYRSLEENVQQLRSIVAQASDPEQRANDLNVQRQSVRDNYLFSLDINSKNLPELALEFYKGLEVLLVAVSPQEEVQQPVEGALQPIQQHVALFARGQIGEAYERIRAIASIFGKIEEIPPHMQAKVKQKLEGFTKVRSECDYLRKMLTLFPKKAWYGSYLEWYGSGLYQTHNQKIGIRFQDEILVKIDGLLLDMLQQLKNIREGRTDDTLHDTLEVYRYSISSLQKALEDLKNSQLYNQLDDERNRLTAYANGCLCLLGRLRRLLELLREDSGPYMLEFYRTYGAVRACADPAYSTLIPSYRVCEQALLYFTAANTVRRFTKLKRPELPQKSVDSLERMQKSLKPIFKTFSTILDATEEEKPVWADVVYGKSLDRFYHHHEDKKYFPKTVQSVFIKLATSALYGEAEPKVNSHAELLLYRLKLDNDRCTATRQKDKTVGKEDKTFGDIVVAYDDEFETKRSRPERELIQPAHDLLVRIYNARKGTAQDFLEIVADCTAFARQKVDVSFTEHHQGLTNIVYKKMDKLGERWGYLPHNSEFYAKPLTHWRTDIEDADFLQRILCSDTHEQLEGEDAKKLEGFLLRCLAPIAAARYSKDVDVKEVAKAQEHILNILECDHFAHLRTGIKKESSIWHLLYVNTAFKLLGNNQYRVGKNEKAGFLSGPVEQIIVQPSVSDELTAARGALWLLTLEELVIPVEEARADWWKQLSKRADYNRWFDATLAVVMRKHAPTFDRKQAEAKYGAELAAKMAKAAEVCITLTNAVVVPKA